MSSREEIKYESFECPRLKSTVQITLEYLIHTSSRIASSGPDLVDPVGFDCDSYMACGVGTQKGLATTFDWGKCVHPLRKNPERD